MATEELLPSQAGGGLRSQNKRRDKMKLKYKCNNGACCKNEKREECVNLQIESVMDEKNIAVMFCPKCGSKLTREN